MPDMNAIRPRPRLRWLRWLFVWLPLLFIVVSIAQVLSLRWLDPPTSAFMLERRLDAWRDGDRDFQLRYRWRSFDFQAIDKDMQRNREGEPVRGASTISQQVAKNMFLWGGRNYVRKGLEAWYTVLIEHLWSKRRILEIYVNIAEFGDGVYGADAAATDLFHTTAARLTPTQAARLVAVLPNPRHWSAAKPNAYVLRRAAWIERQIRQLGGPQLLDRGKR
jgi:monofunctional biosynthetic peptidoglycan transglycosylase